MVASGKVSSFPFRKENETQEDAMDDRVIQKIQKLLKLADSLVHLGGELFDVCN